MSKLPTDHIYVIFAAFLASLGCFTALALAGAPATAIGTVRDVLLMLGGALAGVAVRKAVVTRSTRGEG